jgi:hypothetical protein
MHINVGIYIIFTQLPLALSYDFFIYNFLKVARAVE